MAVASEQNNRNRLYRAQSSRRTSDQVAPEEGDSSGSIGLNPGSLLKRRQARDRNLAQQAGERAGGYVGASVGGFLGSIVPVAGTAIGGWAGRVIGKKLGGNTWVLLGVGVLAAVVVLIIIALPIFLYVMVCDSFLGNFVC